ncbi:MAG: HNH endonuclease [Nitrosomonadaceae bacterium]|nr:HNH endonuclease [Nitrosomonadaceae bacterium]
MEIREVPKICKLCNFDAVVETCHIKPISSFSTDTKLAIVNSESNLVYLCPNHHALLDRQLVELTGFEPVCKR